MIRLAVWLALQKESLALLAESPLQGLRKCYRLACARFNRPQFESGCAMCSVVGGARSRPYTTTVDSELYCSRQQPRHQA